MNDGGWCRGTCWPWEVTEPKGFGSWCTLKGCALAPLMTAWASLAQKVQSRLPSSSCRLNKGSSLAWTQNPSCSPSAQDFRSFPHILGQGRTSRMIESDFPPSKTRKSYSWLSLFYSIRYMWYVVLKEISYIYDVTSHGQEQNPRWASKWTRTLRPGQVH